MKFLSSSALVALQASAAAAAISVDSKILVFARDSSSAETATLGFQGYGIPYQTIIVPQSGAAIPTLNSTSTNGNYGGILLLSDVKYQYATGFLSALTNAQWEQLYAYQVAFGVRMVRLDMYPSTDLGVTTAIAGAGCCSTDVEQYIRISNASAFPTANIKTDANVSTAGFFHYPAVIVDPSIATEFATFDAAGPYTQNTTAAIINNINGRQQMAWFLPWATKWSQTSNYLQHAYIHWMTRGLFIGKRKILLGTQVDDMHLWTRLYYPTTSKLFRTRPSDLDFHAAWQTDINRRLPNGSNYFMEIGHNGNGDIINATAVNLNANSNLCNPTTGVSYTMPPSTPLEFQKPLGTGADVWPPIWISYNWTSNCSLLDSVALWFNRNPNVFAAISHTFTHEELNNATYRDAYRETAFNIAWLKQIGLWNLTKTSQSGLIPPAITGLHNGDALRAWWDNGIRYVVGDNTRPVLRNQQSSFYPLNTTIASNGFTGITVIPRWSTTIYFDCDTVACITQQWNDLEENTGSFADLLIDAKSTNTRLLLGLHPDPFMFHQANLRSGDVIPWSVGPVSGNLSLIQIWVEVITQEMARLTNWPIITLKHDDIGIYMQNRVTLDACNKTLLYNYANDGRSIVSVTVSTDTGFCGVPVPVTLPGTATTSATGGYMEQSGSEPWIYYTQLNGNSVTYNLDTPVTV